MKFLIRLIGLSALALSFLGVTMASAAAEDATVEMNRSSDDCAKKRARGKKCDDDSRSDRNGNRNGKRNSNSNRNGDDSNSNSNSRSNPRSNQNSNSNDNGNSGNSNK